MNNYTIYCTSEQTKKALELGARIGKIYQPAWIESDDQEYTIPTAEQMIGWIEAQYPIRIDVSCYDAGYDWGVWKKTEVGIHLIEEPDKVCPGRKEATLDAIDAALEYLSNNKKKI